MTDAAMTSTLKVLVLASLGLALVDVFASANTLHQHMNTDELRRVFHVESHDQVPEYEIVHVHDATSPPQFDASADTLARESATPDRTSGANSADSANSVKKVPNLKKFQGSVDVGGGGDGADTRHLRLAAFGSKMKLSLKKATGLFKGDAVKMWTIEKNVTEPDEIEYKETDQDNEDIGEIYQDEENMAALLIQDEKGGTIAVEGTIGHELVVKPVPLNLRRHLTPSSSDDELFLDEQGEDIRDDVSMDTGRPLRNELRAKRDVARSQQHIVYKRSMAAADGDLGNDYAFMEPDHLAKKYRRKRSISKREAPYVIYPEILVIVDYDGYRLHGGDNVQIKRYFVSFWNGVDLRYKLLKGPKIRISIAGIIISRGRDATPYLERNRVGRDAIDSAAALTDMGKYLFRERRLPVYDIAVAVTKYDMCRRRKGGRCTKGTAGFAYVGGACVVNKRLEKVNSVAIIEDTGGFSGIIVGAHEVGHLLGAVHDGSPPPSYLGGPGAEKCRWEDGFIMSDLRHTDKGFKWSPCSVISFHHFLNGDTATCLYNSPHEDESLPRVLPGKLLTLDAQCRKDRGTSACFKDDRVCAQLFCFDAGSGYCVAYRPAAEGSSCGDGQYCINGRCTTEHENIIPDYSQNTPTYLRRNDADVSATQSRPVYASLTNATTQRSVWQHTYPSTSVVVPTTTTTSAAIAPPKSNPAVNNPKVVIQVSGNPQFAFRFNVFTPSTSTHHPSDYTRLDTSSTTSHPYYEKYKNYLNKVSTTKNPYDFSNFHRTTALVRPAPSTTLAPKKYAIPTTTPKTTPTTSKYQYTTKYYSPKTYASTSPRTAATSSRYQYTPPSTAAVRYSPTTPKYYTTTTTTENPYYKYLRDITATTKRATAATDIPYALRYTKINPSSKVSASNYRTSATQNVQVVVQASRNDTSLGTAEDTDACLDSAMNIGGSMNCKDFLLRYGYQYCQYRYMRRNCCASHRAVCDSAVAPS